MANWLDSQLQHFDCICVYACFVCLFVCIQRHVAILLGPWWMTDYETLHVCPVPQGVKFPSLPSSLPPFLRIFPPSIPPSRPRSLPLFPLPPPCHSSLSKTLV